MRQVRAKVYEKYGHWPTRKGVPDGFAGKGAHVAEVRRRAQELAKKVVRLMAEKGLIKDEEAGNLALEFAVSVVIDEEKTYQARERLAAAKTVLEYTRAKPAQKSEVTVTRAEDFLSALAAEAKSKG